MTDPFLDLRRPIEPVDPDPRFAADLRDRLRRALLLSPARVTAATGGRSAMSHLTPYLAVRDARAAITWYTDAFGARLVGDPYVMDDDRIGHAELEIGDSVIMLSDEMPDFGNKSPKSVGGTPVVISVYVENVDDVFKKAVDAGANGRREPEDQFYGDRAAQFEDPFGHRWSVASHVEDVPPDEMERRAAEMMGGG